ncbi:MAG: hypothetical protein RLZ98_2502 [Pseudomonadota bacterium]|jgi:release factor glutamine methyltransferase
MTPPSTPGLAPETTVTGAIALLTRAFLASGVPDPARDARLIVQLALGLEPGGHIVHAGRPLAADAGRLAALAGRRCAREPISRIFSEREFYGRAFEISPATLDPRPDTETLIDAALLLLAEDGHRPADPIAILDIGTGSGCILVTLLAELPGATGVGTDISDAALALAQRNARRHGVDDRARFQHLRSSPPEARAFDLIVSNPPYISTGCLETLEPEVRLYDPRPALDGGPDGLSVYRDVLAGLRPGAMSGWCIFEVGYDQAESVAALICAHAQGLGCEPLLRTFADLDGHTRCVAWKARV